MECPKKYAVATMILLEKYLQEGHIEVSEEKAEKISEEILDIFTKYMEMTERRESNDKNVPIGADLFSKSLFYGIAFSEENIEEKRLSPNIVVSNQYNIAISPAEGNGKYDSDFYLTHDLQEEIMNLHFMHLDSEDPNQYVDIENELIKVRAASLLVDAVKEDQEIDSLLRETLTPLFGDIIEKVENTLRRMGQQGTDQKIKDEFSYLFLSEAFELSIVKSFTEKPKVVVAGDDRGWAYILDLSRFEQILSDEATIKKIISSVVSTHYDASIEPEEVNIELKEELEFLKYRIKDRLVTHDFRKRYERNLVKKLIDLYNEYTKNGKPSNVEKELSSYLGIPPNQLKKKKKSPTLSIEMVVEDYRLNLGDVIFNKDVQETVDFLIGKKSFDIKDGRLLEQIEKEKTFIGLEFYAGKSIIIRDDFSQNGERYNKKKIYNSAMNKKSFVAEDILSEFPIFLIDEADKSLSGNLSMALRTVAKNAKNIVAASGTPIGGYAKEMAYQNAYSGLMNSAMIEKNKMEYSAQCGIFQFKTKFLAEIFKYKDKEKVVESIYDCFAEYLVAKNNKKRNTNIAEILIKGVSKIINAICESSLKEDKYRDFESLNTSEEARNIGKLFSAVDLFARSKGISIKDPYSFMESFEIFFMSDASEFLKEYPGINNGKTFVSLVKTSGKSNASIMSREILKKRKEKLNILDLEEVKKTTEKSTIEDYEFFKEHNYPSIRLFQEGMKAFSKTNFLNELYFYVIDNFNLFISGLLKNDKGNNRVSLEAFFSKELGREITYKDIKNLFAKTSSSSTDDIRSMYKYFISLPYDVDADKEMTKNFGREKYKIFLATTKLFSYCFNRSHNASIEEASSISGVTSNIEDATMFTPEKEIGFSIPFTWVVDKLYSGGNRELFTSTIRIGKRGDIYVNKEKRIFTIMADMCKKEWKEFLRPKSDGGFVKYPIRMNNYEEEKLFDVLGSKGVENIIYRNIEEEKSFVLSSNRTGNNIFNLLNLISLGLKRKNKTRPLSIIVNTDSGTFGKTSLKDIVSRLDYDLLEKNNIKVIPSKRSNLDSAVKVEYIKNNQIAVVSNYESISRGLDLSMLDCIVATGAMEKGKELTQFMARLYSVEKDEGNVYMFHGGNDTTIFTFAKEEEVIASSFIDLCSNGVDEVFEKMSEDNPEVELLLRNRKFTSTRTIKENLKGLSKLLTVKYLMSGERSSGINNMAQSKNIITLSKKFSKSGVCEQNDLSCKNENGVVLKTAP